MKTNAKTFLAAVLVLGAVSSGAKASAYPYQQSAIELDDVAAKTIGNLLRKASLKGDRSVQFEGGPQVTTYWIGNLVCYFQNGDDSVSCTVAPSEQLTK